MKYIDEYRDRDLIMKLADRIRASARHEYVFMEVCGGHTAAIHRFGIPALLPENISLISGPGCPVCVTGTDFIDKAVVYSEMDDVIIATFGDLIRVPGSSSSLEKQKVSGADIRIVFSALDALDIARRERDKKVIFPGIGFETTAPGTAVTIRQAMKDRIENFFVLSAHKVMPPAMEAIVKEGTRINGFICPGHVAAVTGSSIFSFLPEKYRLGCVVTGFEPTDLLQAVLMLVEQVNSKIPKVEIQYRRAVTVAGNPLAQKNIKEVFVASDAYWRGFGTIPASGLVPGRKYEKFDAEISLPVKVKSHAENEICICSEILRGLKNPGDCPLFAEICSPENPVGACMVSGEGACSTWYRYRRER
jgi:hydrogenase expression/formation protein HypD